MNARKMPSVKKSRLMYSRPIRISSAMAIAPKMSIIGELIGGGADRAQVGLEQAPGGFAEAPRLPGFHAERLHDAHAGDGFVQDVLDLGQLVLPLRVVLRTRCPMRRADISTNGTKMTSTQASRPPKRTTTTRGEEEGEELLKKLRQHGRNGVLHALDVVDDRRQQRAGRVLLEERDRAPQRRGVEARCAGR